MLALTLNFPYLHRFLGQSRETEDVINEHNNTFGAVVELWAYRKKKYYFSVLGTDADVPPNVFILTTIEPFEQVYHALGEVNEIYRNNLDLIPTIKHFFDLQCHTPGWLTQ
jgi:hypothetical protein